MRVLAIMLKRRGMGDRSEVFLRVPESVMWFHE
jgi:hypothetical protein